MRRTWTLLLLPLLLVGCAEPPAAPSSPRSVLVRTLADPGARELRTYTGDVRARTEAAMGFRVSGRLQQRLDLGARVRKGQIIARLDPVDLDLQAQAAAAQVAVAEAALTLARADWERAEGLQRQSFISSSALDARHNALQAAEAGVRQARAEAARATRQQADAVLQAESDGVITAVLADPGKVVDRGEPVLMVAPEAAREVLIQVPEQVVSQIRPGMPAGIVPLGEKSVPLSGKVREVAPAADTASRTFAVRVALPEQGEVPPLGATATVVFAADGAARMTVPLQAVGQFKGQSVAWVVDSQGVVTPRPLDVASYGDGTAEIASGLSAGERIVVAGIHLLEPGEHVNAIAETAPVALDARR